MYHANYRILLQGTIESLYLDEGELISAGADGYIRVFYDISYTIKYCVYNRYGTLRQLIMLISQKRILSMR